MAVISVFTSVNLVIVYSPNVMIPVKGKVYISAIQGDKAGCYGTDTFRLMFGCCLVQILAIILELLWFSSVLQGNSGIVLQHSHFLPHPFQFVIHHSPY
jgi:hypothetical protein